MGLAGRRGRWLWGIWGRRAGSCPLHSAPQRSARCQLAAAARCRALEEATLAPGHRGRRRPRRAGGRATSLKRGWHAALSVVGRRRGCRDTCHAFSALRPITMALLRCGLCWTKDEAMGCDSMTLALLQNGISRRGQPRARRLPACLCWPGVAGGSSRRQGAEPSVQDAAGMS